MKLPRYSIAVLLFVIACVGVSLAIYRYLNPPPVYPLPTFGSGGRFTVSSVAFDFGYVVELTESKVNRAPTWDRRRGNPPLSANAAMVLADKFRRRLLKKNQLQENIHDGVWEIGAAELIPYNPQRGQWYWLIRFEYHMSQTGPLNELRLVVLMDGTVIEPVISERDPTTPGLFGN